jgi:cell division protein FtsB
LFIIWFIKGILDRITTLENKKKLLESENATQKAEIAILKNNMNNSKNFNDKACTEWRNKLVGKKKKNIRE